MSETDKGAIIWTSMLAQPESFPGLPALAERLGVKPDQGGYYQLRMSDGSTYDVFALLNAFLDRMDALEAQCSQK